MSGAGISQVEFDRVNAIKKVHEKELMAKANVIGVGVGFEMKDGQRTDQLALVVLVERKIPESQLVPTDLIPAEIDGVPVDVQPVGLVRSQG